MWAGRSSRSSLSGLDNMQYLTEDMTMLPDVTCLKLVVNAMGHAFGVRSFHVLRQWRSVKQNREGPGLLQYQNEGWMRRRKYNRFIEGRENRICSGIKRLVMALSSGCDLEEQIACSSGCICDQPTNWKTEELLLNFLQELEIQEFGASEHEVEFLKRLLSWATVLKMLTVHFRDSVTKSKAKEVFHICQSFSRPGVRLKFYIYQNSRWCLMHLKT
ncbi:hypothetical protein EJB05_13976, partial [Eragrostis curvula]